MTTLTKRKLGAVGLRAAGMGAAIGTPAAVVLRKFPLWGEAAEQSGGAVLGVGGVMVLVIVLLGLRRQLWPLIRDKLRINSIGALIFWGLAFALLLGIERIVPMLPDLRTVCISGLVGTGVGQIADTAAGLVDPAGKKVKEVVAHDANGSAEA